jgi:sugar/nucleoside kinase (ribokinase family)
MANPSFRVHGTGCGLGDVVHPASDFSSPRYAPYRSKRPGDGGLEMGKVVFLDDLIAFSGRSRETVLDDLNASRSAFTAGGPGLVSMVLAAQLLRPAKASVTYYGLSGDDAAASRIRSLLAQTPLDMTCYRQKAGRTPVTHVFSDPSAQGGHGDRCFVHDPGDPGVAMDPELFGETFTQATFAVYAGTALMPKVHEVLPSLLAKARRRGAVTIAGPVFDAYAEKAGNPWTLGGDGAWEHLDLLVADADEVIRLAARGDIVAGSVYHEAVPAAVDSLLRRGLRAAVVTRGAGPIYYRSAGGVFGNSEGEAPACAALVAEARDREAHPGDTTGAGDNFLGALVANFVHQILADDFFPKGELHLDRELFHINPLHLRKAIDFAAIAGGLACLQYGGIHIESHKGERLEQIRSREPAPEPSALPWK